MDTLAYLESQIYEHAKTEISEAMGVDHGLFKATWAESRHIASTNQRWTPRERIDWVAKDIGTPLAAAKLGKLADRERDLWTRSTKLDDRTIPTLKAFKANGVRIALTTNGSSAMKELPRKLDIDQYFDTTPLFSCDVGQLKPGPVIYERALEGLGLRAAQCIYVGDGSDRELEGAKAVGLFAVRLTAHRRKRPSYRTSDSLDWDATVASLDELLQRMGIAEPEA